ncbi:PadR family transcriptional regulator [Euzebya rosea]|uniref:PadR family transcriptional regulator n=1 Tax=Euzebya rosea TaxID=2052804 RepID=UPI001300314C|nr:PadR family transcriptional regulator [Euzebya rosea]
MLELAVLGLLKERAMHGYELKRQLGQRLGFFWTVSFGSLYPTLKKLESKGVVERVPDTDGRSRRRQVYRITEVGEAEFLELIGQGSTSAWEEEKFPLRFAFFRYLNTETRVWLLQRRRDYLEDRLLQGRTAFNRARRGRADPYTLSLMRHGIETTEHDLKWIEELLTAEANPGRPDDSHEYFHDDYDLPDEDRPTGPDPAAQPDPDPDPEPPASVADTSEPHTSPTPATQESSR